MLTVEQYWKKFKDQALSAVEDEGQLSIIKTVFFSGFYNCLHEMQEVIADTSISEREIAPEF